MRDIAGTCIAPVDSALGLGGIRAAVIGGKRSTGRIVEHVPPQNTIDALLGFCCDGKTMSTQNTTPPDAKPERLVSLDAYRGFVMFLMAAEMLRVPSVAAHFKDSAVWQWLSFHSGHVAWTGCSLHDLIQPSFSFMVGAALPFSIASRGARGQSKAMMWGHALFRSLLLILLGVFLRSIGKPQTYWTFEDTLSQIGLGYPFLFALGFASARARRNTLWTIAVGYWLFFALYTPAPDHSPAMAGVPEGWTHDFTGFAAHWNINNNPAWAFDRWFLNLLPRAKEFAGSPGGYSTLSFIPTLGTMLLGLIAGQWLKDRQEPLKALKRLIMAGAVFLGFGLLLDASGLCPSVKKIWTPAWIFVSGGWCCLLMAAFYGIIDIARLQRWAFPFVVIGMNSIAMYVMAHTMDDFVGKSLDTHLGRNWAQIAGDVFAPMLHGAAVLLILWLILLWMYRRRIFLRI